MSLPQQFEAIVTASLILLPTARLFIIFTRRSSFSDELQGNDPLTFISSLIGNPEYIMTVHQSCLDDVTSLPWPQFPSSLCCSSFRDFPYNENILISMAESFKVILQREQHGTQIRFQTSNPHIIVTIIMKCSV